MEEEWDKDVNIKIKRKDSDKERKAKRVKRKEKEWRTWEFEYIYEKEKICLEEVVTEVKRMREKEEGRKNAGPESKKKDKENEKNIGCLDRKTRR